MFVGAPLASLAGGDPGFDPVMSGDAGFHPCIPGRCIDHDALPTHDVHALADHDVSGQRNRLCLRIVDAQITAGILILGTAAGRQSGGAMVAIVVLKEK